ncbi:hypothetical protein CI109_103069 [Kwoniella shandongensis]|uniref:Uncharacterized protein n=1 Tax=Kwoniella shandongensis TaxID=1734106 RepID=A0A5M6CE62_9TREE|nr:uncharacterized protein CI109_000260 [Kwoniella shandongensis]KAA5531419.1 hypothetical protein CI109_000260 [Kwoniella shandongensis]
MKRPTLPRSVGLGWTSRPPPPQAHPRITSVVSLSCGKRHLMNSAHILSSGISYRPITTSARPILSNQTSTSSTLSDLLSDPSSDIRTLLTSIDLANELVPPHYVLQVLQRPSDSPSLIHLMPSIVSALNTSEMDDSRRIFKYLVKHIGQHKMLAVLPSVVELFLNRVEREMDSEAVQDAELVCKWYDKLISHLRHFAQNGRRKETDSLPLPVRKEVTKIAQHLIETLRRLPSSSNQQTRPQISRSLLDRLFTRPYLSPELRGVLLKYVYQEGIELRPSQWQQCMLSALEEGDLDAARRYENRKEHAIQRIRDENGTSAASMEKSNSSLAMEADGVNPVARRKRARVKTLATSVGELILARTGHTWDDILGSFDQYMLPSDIAPDQSLGRPDALQRYAWSILLARSSRDHSINAESLLEMAENIPGPALVGHTLTPVMYGLAKRGQGAEAWDIWRDLVQRERDAPPNLQGVFVDRVTLGVATEVCHNVTNLDAAVALVDTWAHRPWMPELPETSIGPNSIKLDAQNINILLNMCRTEGRPSIAFRLWTAALPRYGVHLDDISLNLLLDIARFCVINKEEEKPNDLFMIRLRQMADEFRLKRRSSKSDEAEDQSDGKYDAYDSLGFAKGPTAVLLDPPRYAWRHEFPGEKPWQRARRIVRQVMLGNWPHLREIKSPLEAAHHGAFDSISSFFGGSGSDIVDDVSLQTTTRSIRLPESNARYTHIVPTASTLQRYISLLGYFSRHDEIPIVLAWMKSLSIRPTWTSLQIALTYICEAEGPRRWIKGWGEHGEAALVRDEEVMRRWLEEWLGDGVEEGGRRKVVPTEEDVAAYRREWVERRENFTA